MPVLRLTTFAVALATALCALVPTHDVAASTPPQTCLHPTLCSPPPVFQRTYYQREDAARPTLKPEGFLATRSFDFGGAGTTQIGGMATDAQGNIWVTGGFWGSITLNTTPPTVLTSTQDADVYLAKFTAAGEPLWAIAAEGASTPPGLSLDGGVALVVDAQGNAYIGGGFVDRLRIFDRSGALGELTDDQQGLGFEPFVAKFDTNGALKWINGGKSGGARHPSKLTEGISVVTELSLAPDQTLYASGIRSGRVFLDADLENAPTGTIICEIDSANGDVLGAVIIGDGKPYGIRGMAVDAQKNLYLTGTITDGALEFPGGTLVDPQGIGAYVAKLNKDFQFEWARLVATPKHDVRANHLAIDASGAVYVVGEFLGESVTFGTQPVTGNAVLPSGFLTRIDTAGTTDWTRSFGIIGPASGQRVLVQGDRVHVTGWTASQASFGPFPDGMRTLTTDRRTDMILVTYHRSGAAQSVRAIPGSGTASFDRVYQEGVVPVSTVPTRVVPGSAPGQILLGGDFDGTLTLEDRALTAAEGTRRAFISRLDDPARRRSVRSR
jgi:hypothetical protein